MKDNFSTIENEDHALFLLIKKGDKDAFVAIYHKYHPYLYSLALRYLKNVEAAEETVQHVFVKLWESVRHIEIEINLKNYLYTMTKNYILNYFRDNKKTVSINYVNAQEEILDEDDFPTLLEEMQLLEILKQGIENLPTRKKEVCEMKMEGNVSNQEIADRMGISIHTVKSHYQEAIKMLRNYFHKMKLMLF
ncbi:MAG TPA: RNA polymerase sigma-70 factor [Dysgonamonadaceae bacterium]|jgi:RNA polymerase sigma-70 factor (ECF subfamily)|nr:RNA polymerase sigma-70 factor [Dysgonamonadaceae bacterium]